MQVRALLQGFSQVLRALRLDVIALQVEAEQARRFRDEIREGLRAVVCNLVVAQVNIRNVDRVLLQRLAQHDQRLVGDSVCEVVFVVTENRQVD